MRPPGDQNLAQAGITELHAIRYQKAKILLLVVERDIHNVDAKARQGRVALALQLGRLDSPVLNARQQLRPGYS